MIKLLVHNQDGSIHGVIDTMDSVVDHVTERHTSEGRTVINFPGDFDDIDNVGNYYVLAGEIVPLLDMDITVNGLTFTGLPDPVTARVKGALDVSGEITGGEMVFSAERDGEYTVTFIAFPYQAKEVVFNVGT